MDPGTFTFEEFSLDHGDRRLCRAGEPVEISNRYFDALALLLSEPGKLVSKDRFMDEVWRGIPVTDEALTQCIKTLRRQLGDDAASPRFIETVPKHGYRFIAPVMRLGSAAETRSAAASGPWPAFWLTGAAGAVGGGLAGLLGGFLYGFAASAQGMGATTLLLVLMALTAGLGLIGGAGVGLGIGAAAFAPIQRWQWPVLGGLAGGFVVGALAKLLGLDAFNLLFGHAPRDMTGASEGALLGAAIGFGTWLARGGTPLRGIACGALTGAVAGLLIPMLGGHMLGGSLDLLARQFPDSHVRLDSIAHLLGESGFGRVSQTVTGAIEGTVFGAGVVGALTIGRRYLR
uniref:winged helix-turn-helix domain-containing protein n=1 Tax=Altererythrobacter segetis TaxID=1104773 RepID=UPI00140DE10F|nr:transcriptional regulator [Altererythrobacter segetis]